MSKGERIFAFGYAGLTVCFLGFLFNVAWAVKGDPVLEEVPFENLSGTSGYMEKLVASSVTAEQQVAVRATSSSPTGVTPYGIAYVKSADSRMYYKDGTGSEMRVTEPEATSSVTGAASFDAGNFSVAAGHVTLAASGVTDDKASDNLTIDNTTGVTSPELSGKTLFQVPTRTSYGGNPAQTLAGRISYDNTHQRLQVGDGTHTRGYVSWAGHSVEIPSPDLHDTPNLIPIGANTSGTTIVITGLTLWSTSSGCSVDGIYISASKTNWAVAAGSVVVKNASMAAAGTSVWYVEFNSGATPWGPGKRLLLDWSTASASDHFSLDMTGYLEGNQP